MLMCRPILIYSTVFINFVYKILLHSIKFDKSVYNGRAWCRATLVACVRFRLLLLTGLSPSSLWRVITCVSSIKLGGKDVALSTWLCFPFQVRIPRRRHRRTPWASQSHHQPAAAATPASTGRQASRTSSAWPKVQNARRDQTGSRQDREDLRPGSARRRTGSWQRRLLLRPPCPATNILLLCSPPRAGRRERGIRHGSSAEGIVGITD